MSNITKTPEITPFPVWSTDEGENPVTRFNALPNAQIVKDGVLFGIPLASNLTNQTLSDSTINKCINEAISEIEHLLDLYITPVTFTEEHDYEGTNFNWDFNYMKLNHPNLLNVEKVCLKFNNVTGTNPLIDFPLEFVAVQPQESVIRLVPSFGIGINAFLMASFSGAQFHALRSMGMNYFPNGIQVQYTSGFQQDKVPALLTALIETITAIKVLSLLSPVLFPWSSVGISIDGTSQSTSNPGVLFFQNRIKELEAQKESQMEAAAGYYQRKFLLFDL